MNPIAFARKHAVHQVGTPGYREFIGDLRLVTIEAQQSFRNSQKRGEFTDDTGDAFLKHCNDASAHIKAEMELDALSEPSSIQLQAPKEVSLADLHEWILATRDLYSDDSDGMVEIKIVSPEEDEGPTTTKMIAINEAMKVVRTALEDFDALFHDFFDCR